MKPNSSPSSSPPPRFPAQQPRPRRHPPHHPQPYFSIRSNTDKLTASNTVHWTGKPQLIARLVRIDGRMGVPHIHQPPWRRKVRGA